MDRGNRPADRFGLFCIGDGRMDAQDIQTTATAGNRPKLTAPDVIVAAAAAEQ